MMIVTPCSNQALGRQACQPGSDDRLYATPRMDVPDRPGGHSFHRHYLIRSTHEVLKQFGFDFSLTTLSGKDRGQSEKLFSCCACSCPALKKLFKVQDQGSCAIPRYLCYRSYRDVEVPPFVVPRCIVTSLFLAP